MVPEGYHEFFVAAAGVAGALIGLLFVAISVNPKAASSGPVRQRLRPAAALSAFLNPPFVSLVALLPEADMLGAFVALGSVATLAMLGLLSFVVLEMRGEGVRPLLRTLLTLVLQLANSVAQLVAAIVLLGDASTRRFHGTPSSECGISATNGRENAEMTSVRGRDATKRPCG